MQSLIFVLIIAFLLFLCFALPLLLQRRAIIAVIKIFRQKNALKANNALTRDELGIVPQTFFSKMLKLRDYKPDALNLLLSTKIVKETADEKLYFSREEFSTLQRKTSSRMLKFLLPKRLL
ncbi:MAG: hypothetical protein GX996_06300 [Firmicutes bacterium]|nr:hypothetical protein [Bacillota bacterium]